MINILITLAAFLTMEFVAWFTHKYIMHGLLWILHKDHHHKESNGFFEHNDFFFSYSLYPEQLESSLVYKLALTISSGLDLALPFMVLLISLYMIFLFINDLSLYATWKTIILKPSEEPIKYIIKILEKSKANVLVCCGFRSSILKIRNRTTQNKIPLSLR